MADINLTSTTVSGFLETDFNQLKDVLQDGGVEAISFAVKDNGFTIVDESDITKKIAFQASSITAGTTRTITMPDNDVDLGDLSTFIASISEDTSPQLGGNLDADSNSMTNINNIEIEGHSYVDSEVDDGNSSTADTIDWTTGNFHKSTLTGNVTYTFTAPSGPTTLVLKLVQDATGSRTATWPASVKWPGGTAPTLTTDANATDLISFYYDGTNYWGSSVLDLQ